VIAASADAPLGERDAILLSGESVVVADLTVATPDRTNGVVATAGVPRIEQVSFVGPEESGKRTEAHVHRPFTSMGFFGQTSPTIEDCEWNGYVSVREGATATFAGNTVIGDTISIDGPGESSVRDSVFRRGSISMSRAATGVIEGNESSGDLRQVGIDAGSAVEVRGNTFDDAAIWIEDQDTSAVVSGNTVTDSKHALRITGGGMVTVAANTLDVTAVGITFSGTDAHIEGKIMESDVAGIVIDAGANPTVTADTIDAGERAITVGRGSAPVITDNVVCGAEVSFCVEEGAEPQTGDNEVCEGATPE